MTPEERISRYARLVVEVGVNLQPGQLLRINGHPDHLPLIRAIAEVAYSRRRTLRRDGVRRSARSEVADPARSPRTRSTGRRRGGSRSSTSSRSTNGAVIQHHGRSRARALQRSRPRPDREGPPATARRAFPAGDGRRPDRVDDRRLSERRLGADGLRRARRRAAVGGGCDRDAPRRAGSGRRVARAHRPPSGARRAARRAPLRPDPLLRARHRPHASA